MLVYLDNAATTFPKPELVYLAMDKCARELGVNVGRGQYPLAEKVNNLIEKTRAKVLELFHARTMQVIFTPSSTIAINIVLQGIDWDTIRNVYISPFEHNAVQRTINYLQILYKFTINILDVNRIPFYYNIEKQSQSFSEVPPDLIILNHASNVCGAVAPAKQIFTLAKTYGAITVLDVAQSAGLIDVNMVESKIDFVVFAGHKALMGPLGVGGIVMSDSKYLKPILFGGTGFDSRNPFMPDSLPFRLEAGSPNIVAIAGLSASLDWIQENGIRKLHSTEQQMYRQLKSMLSKRENIQLVGTDYKGEQVGVLSCLIDGYSADEIGLVLGQNNIAVRSGLHCAPGAHDFFGTYPGGTIRMSVGFSTSLDDIEVLAEVLSRF